MYLSKPHYGKYGTDTGVLDKIIGSLGRLTIQVHPDMEFAKKVFRSDYGKTEAWYILGGRKVNGEDPYVFLGFKPGIDRKGWKEPFRKQDIGGMLDALHKICVKPGEVFFIGGGVPHAIGPGCFLIEIQEPTDYTIRAERKTPEGKAVPDDLCHQGAGFERIFDCFNYNAFTQDETLLMWRFPPKKLYDNDVCTVNSLVDSSHTSLFGMNRVIVRRPVSFIKQRSILLSGCRFRSRQHKFQQQIP